jgi:hypothetical protein
MQMPQRNLLDNQELILHDQGNTIICNKKCKKIIC